MALRGTIDDFKASVVNDFARPNLFQVDLNFPATLGISSDLSTFGNFTVGAANLPASQIGVVEVPFRGRVLKNLASLWLYENFQDIPRYHVVEKCQ